MGKYNADSFQNDKDFIEPRNFWLCRIANELAEANRLRRLQLIHAEISITTDDEA